VDWEEVSIVQVATIMESVTGNVHSEAYKASNDRISE